MTAKEWTEEDQSWLEVEAAKGLFQTDDAVVRLLAAHKIAMQLLSDVARSHHHDWDLRYVAIDEKSEKHAEITDFVSRYRGNW